ncbi:MAG: T9SS type A sorting domain-containing protein [Bacteroidota bacterium]
MRRFYSVFFSIIAFSLSHHSGLIAGSFDGDSTRDNLRTSENHFKIVTWNIEWFGHGNGPDDNDLQAENVIKLVQAIDADIYALQEMTNINGSFDQLIDELIPLGYDGVRASYPGGSSTQRTGYIWKTSTVEVVEERRMLNNIGNGFWASGRLPQLLVADVTINGITQRVHVVNIHANAGGSDYEDRVFDVKPLYDTLNEFYNDKNVVFLGDYNDDVDIATVRRNGEQQPSPYIHFAEDPDNWYIVSKILSENGIRTRPGSSNPIDHITVSNELEELIVENSLIVETDIIDQTVTSYTQTTSDHLPVSVEIDLRASVVTSLDEELQEGVTVQVYPNPANSFFNISLQGENITGRVTAEISDALGRITDRKTLDAQNSYRTTVDIQGHNPGIYYVRLSSTSGSLTRKLLIK